MNLKYFTSQISLSIIDENYNKKEHLFIGLPGLLFKNSRNSLIMFFNFKQ